MGKISMTKKKNKTANAVMVLLIAAIFAAGILGVGYIRGWFGDREADNVSLTQVKGIVNLTRNNVTYPVEADTVLRAGDEITCTPGGSGTILVDSDSALYLGEQAALTVTDPDRSGLAVKVTAGELFAQIGSTTAPVTLSYELGAVELADTVASLSVRTGAQDVNVYYGAAGGAEAGEALHYVGDAMDIVPMDINGLNAFAIARLRAANETTPCCFTAADLDTLEAERQAAKDAESMAAMSADLAALGLEHTCTVTIRCDTILDHYEDLEPEKAEFVPDDGILLAKVQVPFAEGETALDATVRACDAYDLQIEYSWTPLYNSSYVEGINQIYEFDCGPESGWIYKVNGWVPNFGCSAYTLKDGDDILWAYSCVGLGADVGGQAW